MGRKKVLEKRLARLQAKKTKLTERALASQDAAEVRSINEELSELNEEIAETQEEIDAIGEPDPKPEPNQQRSNPPVGAQQVNNKIPMASYSQNPAGTQQRENKDPYASMEYREAFKAYVQRGTPIPADLTQRAGGDAGPTVAADLGMIIPTTIMNEFIKKVSKVYGQLYSKVRKLNIPGGVKVPISDLKANFKWITETAASDRQKAGDIKEYVEFSYNIGEIRVSQTLLSQVVALQMFEDEIVRIMTEAYVEARSDAGYPERYQSHRTDRSYYRVHCRTVWRLGTVEKETVFYDSTFQTWQRRVYFYRRYGRIQPADHERCKQPSGLQRGCGVKRWRKCNGRQILRPRSNDG